MLFVLLMQNVWKYVDDLIGKGLEWTVVIEFIIYILPTLVPLALPLAILLSSLMAFGKLGETYELTALKSSGISLLRIMSPLFITVSIIAVFAFFSSVHLVPYSNMKFKTLLYDVMNKKLALNIREGVFFNDIEGYSIKVAKKSDDGKILEDIIIYDQSQKMGNTKVIRAKKGKMYSSENERYLYLELTDGHSYEELNTNKPKSKEELPFARSSFSEERIRFDMSSFQLERSDEEKYSNAAQFMNLSQLKYTRDSLQKNIAERELDFNQKLHSYYNFDSIVSSSTNLAHFNINSLDKKAQSRIYKAAASQLRSTKSYIYNSKRELKYKNKKLNKAKIEWHRKYTLSFACIVLFLIGAPLGAIIRKGGMGMPVLISIIFFLIYHISSITGEKSAVQGVISIFEGMWISSILLTPLGIYFTYKASKDSPLFNISGIVSFIKRPFNK